ncbi:exosortase family protein XrtF [Flavobacteriaceae bacterium GSB9]|nr:exosortase family protein XrtF [Flavobacteriaceae bacterium GSB9]
MKYKSVIKFILTFLVVYGILSVAYKFYLQSSNGTNFYPDYMTYMVGKQSGAIIETLGYNVEVIPHPDEPSLKMILNGNYLARVIEGCNAISVIILFLSFIVAFAGTWKTTFFYILSGSVLIYSVNLLRIALLTLGLYHYPEYEDMLHAVIFPAIIYGMVFLLWIFWVNRFSKIKNSHE